MASKQAIVASLNPSGSSGTPSITLADSHFSGTNMSWTWSAGRHRGRMQYHFIECLKINDEKKPKRKPATVERCGKRSTKLSHTRRYTCYLLLQQTFVGAVFPFHNGHDSARWLTYRDNHTETEKAFGQRLRGLHMIYEDQPSCRHFTRRGD